MASQTNKATTLAAKSIGYTKESTFQVDVIAALRKLLPTTTIVMSIPNEGSGGNPIRGKRLKDMGAMSGAPDILIIKNGKVFGLELKLPKGVVSKTQKNFHELADKAGMPIRVCRSMSDVAQALNSFNIVKG